LGGGGARLGKVDETAPFVKRARKVHHFARFDVSSEHVVATVVDVNGMLVEPPFSIPVGRR